MVQPRHPEPAERTGGLRPPRAPLPPVHRPLAHHREGDERIVLTAGTRDLQRFVLKHLGEGELFQKPNEMVRKKN
jgi:hypothetical protein